MPPTRRVRTLASSRAFPVPSNAMSTPLPLTSSRIAEVTNDLIENLAGKPCVDLVDDFAYPLPVTAICRLLGVPREDQPRFHQWADAFTETADPTTGTFTERQHQRNQAQAELGAYLDGPPAAHARHPGHDLISR